MTLCPVSGKSCEWNSPGPVGTIAKPCPKSKGAIWVHVLDDLGNNIKDINTHKDDGSQQSTDPNGLSTYDPLDPNTYKVSLPPLSKALLDEYYPPDTDTYNAVGVSDGQITYVGFELKRRMNNVTPDMTVDKQEVQQPFPDQKTIDDQIHHFQPEKKPADDKPQVVAVTLTYKETLPKYAYDQGGVFTVTGVQATLWKDAECKTPIDAPGGSLNVGNSDLKGGYKFYMRGDAAGTATLSLTLQDSSKDRVVVDTNAVTKDVTVKAVNRVTPFLKAEHLVVLLDQELFKEQRKNDSEAGSVAAEEAQQIHPDTTRLELSAQQTAQAPEYKGEGKLVLSAANVKLYEDEDCKTEFNVSTKIKFADLIADKPKLLYMRGTTAGKFNVELQLDASTDGLIKVDGPAKGELGCVELKLKLFQFKTDDINQAVEPDVDDATTFWNQMKGLTFEQKEMSKAERVGTGRMLQVQRDKNCARAKLILERVKDQWPDAAKDYKIILDAADWDKKNKTRSGALKLFDKDEEGTEIALPQKQTLDDADKKTEVWVEGTTKCDAWRGIRISAGFERPDGGPDWKPKLDGDWGAFTVINIKEVKCGVDNEAGQEKFVDGSKVYINLDDKGRLLKTVAGKRKADITAEIEPKLKDVDLYFCIVESKDNFAIATLPDKFKEKKIAALKHTLKAVDKDDRKKLLHMTVKTDDQGKAKIETLQMPQLGLMKFKVGAYIVQDPQQARYVDQHTDKELQKAPVLSSDWLEVWRRLFYGVVAIKRWSGASYLDRCDETRLKDEGKKVGLELEKSKADVVKDFEFRTVNYVAWARNALGGAAPARTFYLALVNAMDIGNLLGPDTEVPVALGAPGGANMSFTFNQYIRFPSLTDSAKFLKSATLANGGVTKDIAATATFTLTQIEDFKFTVDIDLTAVLATIRTDAFNAAKTGGDDDPTATGKAQVAVDDWTANGDVNAIFWNAQSPSGLSSGELVAVCMDTREPKHGTQNAADSASHTFMHELGHYLGLAGKTLPDETDSVNPAFYYRQKSGGGWTTQNSVNGTVAAGVGPHCDELGGSCILWYSFKMTLDYCKTCQFFLRSRAMDSPPISGLTAV